MTRAARQLSVGICIANPRLSTLNATLVVNRRTLGFSRTYDWLERELDVDSALHVGHIAVATALSWIEFRELPGFRSRRPRLAAWFETFAARDSMRATPLSGATHD
jgi:hypothetical protein